MLAGKQSCLGTGLTDAYPGQGLNGILHLHIGRKKYPAKEKIPLDKYAGRRYRGAPGYAGLEVVGVFEPPRMRRFCS
jgi:hypothetical protein